MEDAQQITCQSSLMVRLAIERNIDEICPKRNPQSRTQHENLDVRSVEATRPLWGVALFDETCDFTDEEAQEATVQACRRANPALYIMILTDSEDALSEEQFLALKTLHRSEGSAWFGRDLRQAETGTRLKSNLSAMKRARVWTNSFTMAEHIQQEAIGREGPLHSEELFHLLRTVLQGEALSYAMHIAQRLRDTGDDDTAGNLVAAAHRTRFG